MDENTNTKKNGDSNVAPTLLIIESSPYWLNTIKSIFESCDWNIIGLSNPRKTMEVLSETEPDAIIMNYILSNTSGDVLSRNIKSHESFNHIPVAILTFLKDGEIQAEALRAGADLFITNPIDVNKLICKISCLVKKGSLQKLMRQYKNKIHTDWYDMVSDLQSKVNRLNECTKRQILKIMKQAGMANSGYKEHLSQMEELCATMARRLQLPGKNVRDLSEACCLKDIGNAVIPKPILHKPGRLDSTERKIIQQHTYIGNHILNHSESEALQMAARIALNHHERWDGNGYPRGLQENGIPIEARITSVADVFIALCEPRPFRPPFKRYEAFQFIRQGSGTKFDPGVVKAFEKTVF